MHWWGVFSGCGSLQMQNSLDSLVSHYEIKGDQVILQLDSVSMRPACCLSVTVSAGKWLDLDTSQAAMYIVPCCWFICMYAYLCFCWCLSFWQIPSAAFLCVGFRIQELFRTGMTSSSLFKVYEYRDPGTHAPHLPVLIPVYQAPVLFACCHLQNISTLPHFSQTASVPSFTTHMWSVDFWDCATGTTVSAWQVGLKNLVGQLDDECWGSYIPDGGGKFRPTKYKTKPKFCFN